MNQIYLTDKTMPLYNSGETTDTIRIHTTTREFYERDLAERQRNHIEQVTNRDWQPCMHDTCPNCLGTGINRFGGGCIHGISCPCPKCNIH